MPRMSTKSSATKTAPPAVPRTAVISMKKIRAMKQESMKTSPWAKFTMPMMPNTIV